MSREFQSDFYIGEVVIVAPFNINSVTSDCCRYVGSEATVVESLQPRRELGGRLGYAVEMPDGYRAVAIPEVLRRRRPPLDPAYVRFREQIQNWTPSGAEVTA